ncbi:SpaA isopeptide-forming pilin-related protein [Enterococcus sp. AZ196]|uniref:SpaA isopeptide-forming pilin-related protein n=1 Tax=Enterococcus sp. AZ196 TaxID=2774659 RepID=UPI003D29195D
MRKPIQLKRMVPLLLPVVLIIGVLFFYYQGKALKASAPDPLVSVTVDKKAVEKDSLETDKETVELTLKAKDTDVFEIPYDDTVSVVPLNEEGQEIAYPQLDSSDFKKSDALKLFEDRVKTVQSSSNSSEKDEQESSIKEENKRLPYYQVRKEEGKGSFYFELEKDQEQRVRLTRLTKKEKSVDLKSLKDTNRTQPIVVFQATKVLKEPESKLSANPEEAINLDEQPETSDISKSETEEESTDTEKDKAPINPQAISTTKPFDVAVDVGKKTGVSPFDKKNEPGYDTSETNDVVRTFDQVVYEFTMSIQNMSSKYTSLKVRLDEEISDAWRADKSGKMRQTAEFANGNVVNVNSTTKKSTRSTWALVEKSTAQVKFTETVNTYGGVNGDNINPNFVITIESAVTSSGVTEEINQVIDSSVAPVLSEKTKVVLSAKPNVDIKLAWNSNRMTTFEKATGTKDKENTMITNVAAYAKLKPLPDRADTTPIKGSTFPVGGIKYKIDQKMIYKASNSSSSKILNIGTDTEPMEVVAFDGLTGWNFINKTFTDDYQKYSPNFNGVIRQGLRAPVGYTNPSETNTILRGIYNTGNPKATNSLDHSIEVTNTDYVPASIGKDKWYLNGNTMGSNEEPFSVIAMQTTFPYDYLEKNYGEEAHINYHLEVTEVEYENTKQSVDSSIDMIWYKKWPGGIETYSSFTDKDSRGLNSGKDRDWVSVGDGNTAKNNEIYASSYASFVDLEADESVLYSRWNSNTLKFDDTRPVRISEEGAKKIQTFYGVGRAFPNVNARLKEVIDKEYSWYESPEEASEKGEISAVKTTYKVTDASGTGKPRIMTPLIAMGKKGATDDSGNGNILLTNVFNYKNDGEKLTSSFPTISKADYKATKYDEDGKKTADHAPMSSYGDTLYISNMTIRPTINSNKNTFSPDDRITWTVDANVDSGSDKNHKIQLDVTIPKETDYIPGTAKDYQNNVLRDPLFVDNKDGTKTLRWVLDYKVETPAYKPTVSFDTKIVSSRLSFNGSSTSLHSEVVAGVCLEEDENVKDDSDEKKFRTSVKDVVVTNSGVMIVDKEVDKPYIESGNKIDPANPLNESPTDFTYTISFKNHSSSDMSEVRVLDVLPYMGDGRGTQFDGAYTTIAAELTGGTGEIWYSKSGSYTPETNPNGIPLTYGWYKLGSDMTELKDAKAIMVLCDTVKSSESLSLNVTLRPDRQKPGNKYVNSASLNSILQKHVQGVPSTVQVYGRDLSGVAWYDDNLDGLIGNKPAGGAEEWAKDIPVKLYRTSIEVPTYKKELVKESLTGEKFIDASGNSLKKTDANGKYLFENLPEGEYVAEFTIGDKVIQREVRVTKQLEGSDPTKNSKADKESYQTPEYKQPILSEVAGLGATDSKNHVTDVNLGLIRPSTIRLFKYATGTAIDANQDGKLSEAEKATGTPLKDAEFEVYEGDAKTPFATETTDGSGYLNFVKLFPGEHTLIETKAPSGYELIKSPIKVTITEGNQTIKVYQEDDKKADLPFTGGNGPMFAILLAASGALILGFGYMLWYYRMPKRKGGR